MIRTLSIAAVLLCAVPAASMAFSVHADVATRVGPNVYRLEGRDIEVHTVECTSSAERKPAILEVDGPRSRLLFLDDQDRVEDECRLAQERVRR